MGMKAVDDYTKEELEQGRIRCHADILKGAAQRLRVKPESLKFTFEDEDFNAAVQDYLKKEEET